MTILKVKPFNLSVYNLYLFVNVLLGQLPELIDVIIEEKVKLLVIAIGIPPKEVVDRVHKAGILGSFSLPFSFFGLTKKSQ